MFQKVKWKKGISEDKREGGETCGVLVCVK